MSEETKTSWILADVRAGFVVFLVALPLCLGIALASGAPMMAGLIAGVVGGIVVGLASGSHSSVSGPAAGLTAVVIAQLAALESFPTFLLALVIAGFIQIGLGVGRAGFLAGYVPGSVINGLLAAIGLTIILKQIPHLVGHDPDPEGDFSYEQADGRNTFTELLELADDFQVGSVCIGSLALALLLVWDRFRFLKRSPLPPSLVVVLIGLTLSELFRLVGEPWFISVSHLVQVPSIGAGGWRAVFQFPDFEQLGSRKVYIAAFTIALVASLETLLNLEAVDKIDPRRRTSPPNRELVAQGIGNTVCGLVGGIPVTSVIVRSSMNIDSGARTKLSAILHGLILAGCVAAVPGLLNRIPLSCLAAILIATGYKLASPKVFKAMAKAGRNQFVPFLVTIVAILFTDLMKGVGIGLAAALANILRSNLRKPMRRVVEKHLHGQIVRLVFASQVSFLNRAALAKELNGIARGERVVLDAEQTDYIDPDILALIREFRDEAGERGIDVRLVGFKDSYIGGDSTEFVDFSTRDLQDAMTPAQVLQLLRDGNERFRAGRRLTRDLGRQALATAGAQHPLAVVLSCIDSRTPAELIFDTGVGDIFGVRLAGNVLSGKALGSLEYACAVAGAKLIVVLGHTNCGAVGAAIRWHCGVPLPEAVTNSEGLKHIVADIGGALDGGIRPDFEALGEPERRVLVDTVASRNVLRVVEEILIQSALLKNLVKNGTIALVGGIYDVSTGKIEYLYDRSTDAVKGHNLPHLPATM